MPNPRFHPVNWSVYNALQSDKLQQTGQKQGRVFNSRRGCVHAVQLHCFETKLTNLKLKTLPKQLLGYLPLDTALNT